MGPNLLSLYLKKVCLIRRRVPSKPDKFENVQILTSSTFTKSGYKC